MPTAGLSLVGFMDEPNAIQHLSAACVPANPDPVVLKAEWLAAQATLGAPIPNAGRPDVQSLPRSYDAYVQQLYAVPQFQSILGGGSIQLVEIDPLLAYQFVVDTDRSDHHCSAFRTPPPLDELLACCLPLNIPSESIQSIAGQNSLLLKARSLNVRTFGAGMFNSSFIGIQFGVSFPYVQVVRFNGRYYLHNGFHRAYGARRAGATHIPCLLRDVQDAPAVGIRVGTFDLPLLESSNPPTVGHFTQGRAHPVQLRLHSRVLHVSWAEYVMPDE